ncbi:hypothetical protein PC9H_001757 [Pleurotus ostreatus]|uniref:Uncharacterized protein n=1 Tax=Pleurotus ostreatus TaxID=5322 RepID=A0A8H6ZHD8_PLEOS|nr:uncharacterized protein PC9H_001757 [Pleurotus ostreatus]KAF7419173.1 hypothetical protein PC9H_001757 [Pleurotus ostreatus]
MNDPSRHPSPQSEYTSKSEHQYFKDSDGQLDRVRWNSESTPAPEHEPRSQRSAVESLNVQQQRSAVFLPVTSTGRARAPDGADMTTNA